MSVVDRVQALMDSIEASQKAMKGFHTELKGIQKELVKAEKQKAAKKVKKDPNAPKRPKTAYIFFCDDQRVAIKKKAPEMPQTQLMSMLGELWKKIREKEKHKYDAMAAKDKVRYEKDMVVYRASSSSGSE